MKDLFSELDLWTDKDLKESLEFAKTYKNKYKKFTAEFGYLALCTCAGFVISVGAYNDWKTQKQSDVKYEKMVEYDNRTKGIFYTFMGAFGALSIGCTYTGVTCVKKMTTHRKNEKLLQAELSRRNIHTNT